MFYNFVKTVVNRLGVGVGDQAYVRSTGEPINSIYNPAYNVRGQLASTVGGAMLINDQVVIVGITGNGSMINGSSGLMPLAEVER